MTNTTLIGLPLAATGQTNGLVRRIAYLGSTNPDSVSVFWNAFLRVLHERGWTVGSNLTIDQRFAAGNPALGPVLIRGLLALKPDVFVASVDRYALMAAQTDRALPVVFIIGFDPVGIGLVESLARPGRNATGLSVLNYELNPKRLSLLKEALPRLNRVGVLYREGDAGALTALKLTERAARELGIATVAAPFQGPDDFGALFRRLAAGGLKAVINVPDSLLLQHRKQLADLAIEHRIAAAFGATEYADAGMLLAYAADFQSIFERAALLVDRLLRGAKPADIPVEQANVYELVLNLRTARALGIDIPRSLLLQATRIIE